MSEDSQRSAPQDPPMSGSPSTDPGAAASPGSIPAAGPPIGYSAVVPRWPEVPATSDERSLAVLIHILTLFTGGIIGPLIIWLLKKDESPFIDVHGRTAVNFSITMFIAAMVSIPLMLVLIGFVTLMAIVIISIIFPILAAVKASRGEPYTYPLSFHFFK